MRLSIVGDILATFPKLGDKKAIRYISGYRTLTYTYSQLYEKVCACVGYLRDIGFKKGDSLILWGETSPDWIVYFWSCVALGIRIVPIDHRYSSDFVKKVASIVKPKGIVLGEVNLPLSEDVEFKKILFHHLETFPNRRDLFQETVSENDVIQVVFTSGTTSSPKGVIQRHINICSNLNPILDEIGRYRPFLKVMGQLKVLNLLPFSHMFGQTLGLFFVPLIGGCLVITDKIDPTNIVKTIKQHGVNILVCVPWFLRQIKDYIVNRLRLKEVRSPFEIFRVHKILGFRFFMVVTGGSFLELEVEKWWRRAGFLLMQGYGLTETSPIVAINHPFKSKTGSLGKKIKGQEIRLSSEGEILVKGKNVCKEYITNYGLKVLDDDWFPTGDFGALDKEGRLYFKGRKKDMIVTSSGENVFPEDVEMVLKIIEGVKDCVVVGKKENGEEVVHAVLILEGDKKRVDNIIFEANRLLQPHQRIKSWSLWPNEDFPRTPTTLKVKRSEVLKAIDTNYFPTREGISVEDAISHIKKIPKDLLSEEMRLKEDLMFSSTEYVDLICYFEERGVCLKDDLFYEVNTLGDLKRIISVPDIKNALKEDDISCWRWGFLIRIFRFLWINFFLIPLSHLFFRIKVKGIDVTKDIKGPVIIAANHTSHMDIVILLRSLPFNIRNRMVVLISSEPFVTYFESRGGFFKRLWGFFKYTMTGLLFNALPISGEPVKMKFILSTLGKLMDKGFSLLIFPEGIRSRDGLLKPFKPGIYILARKLKIGILPIYIKNAFEVLPIGSFIPRSKEVEVKFLSIIKPLPDETQSQFLHRLEEQFLDQQEKTKGRRNEVGI